MSCLTYNVSSISKTIPVIDPPALLYFFNGTVYHLCHDGANGLTDIYHTPEVVHIFNIPHGTHEEVTADYLSPEQKEEFDRLVRKILEI